jgi:predicted nuclease of predicted toxin-antitoxin system
MKLLLDTNISHRLAADVQDIFPETIHVRFKNFQRSDDREIWNYAGENGYTIVSKDSDFHELSLLFGVPPKVIWIRRGNCSTKEIEEILRTHNQEIQHFETDVDASCLIIW